ncbi:MAG: peptidoglycan-associated lipoprotein Pal [Gemmatimonadetes bacterium]|nr:peptidoglycan-associated lipoprotein Pal [Gemmatimonadota bacterium]
MKRRSLAAVLFLSIVFFWGSGCGDANKELLDGDLTGGDTTSETDTDSRTGGIPTDTGDAPKITPAGEYADYVFTRIQYDFDQYRLTPGSRATLTEHAKVLMANPMWSVVVEGHCDERGTVEYNLALGEKRADSARSFLVQYGVSGDRVRTISYGKERPLVAQSNESAWAQNRRAEFRVTK